MHFHSVSADQALRILKSGKSGLSQAQARKRLARYGENVLEIEEGISALRIFIDQFRSILIIILIAAALISYAVGFFPGQESGTLDALLIMAIVFANGIFGFVQDYKAEKSIEEIRKLSGTYTLVIRDGKRKKISSKGVVPGDVVILEEGDVVPADCRILNSSDLKIDESILTGESAGEDKNTRILERHTPLAERKNMLWMNTLVIRGRCSAVITATGLETEVGRIASEIQKAEKPMTPFQSEISSLGKKIGIGVMGIIIFIALAQLLMGTSDIVTIFLVSIALAVAAIPEGLPAVVTLSLAIGTRKMLAKNALVRKLPVVESLGSIDVICTDKTGTLTENRMTVRKAYFGRKIFDIEGSGYSKSGEFLCNHKKAHPSILRPLLEAGFLCNNSSVDNEKGEIISGDPTEAALIVSAAKGGIEKIRGCKELREISFSSERKRMTKVFSVHGSIVAFMKGAPEVVLEKCDKIYENGKEIALTEKRRREILSVNEKFAANSMRVLAFASRKTRRANEKSIEHGMTFMGLQAMIDPPKRGVKESVITCRKAGIRTVMITGDNLVTARAIAGQIGMKTRAMQGKDIEYLNEKGMSLVVEKTDIFARVTPQQKVKILKALQKNGHRVAITGDGVNDAPALKSSDVGVSMGLRGSDVAKEASDMVLLDDHFATIVSAIREGRTIFDNIRKFVNYLLTCNFAEVLVVFFASIFGFLAITPAQLLWINLLTDGASAIALAADPPEKNIMKKKPRKRGDGVISKRVAALIASNGAQETIILLSVFAIGLSKGLVVAQSMLFTGFVLFESVRIMSIRAQENLSWFSNKYLIVAIAFSMMLQLIVIYSPMNQMFGIVPLGIFEWGVLLTGVSIAWFGSIFITKRIAERFVH